MKPSNFELNTHLVHSVHKKESINAFPLQIMVIEEALNSPKKREALFSNLEDGITDHLDFHIANPQELAQEKVRGCLYETDTALPFQKRQIAPFARGCFGQCIEK